MDEVISELNSDHHQGLLNFGDLLVLHLSTGKIVQGLVREINARFVCLEQDGRRSKHFAGAIFSYEISSQQPAVGRVDERPVHPTVDNRESRSIPNEGGPGVAPPIDPPRHVDVEERFTAPPSPDGSEGRPGPALNGDGNSVPSRVNEDSTPHSDESEKAEDGSSEFDFKTPGFPEPQHLEDSMGSDQPAVDDPVRAVVNATEVAPREVADSLLIEIETKHRFAIQQSTRLEPSPLRVKIETGNLPWTESEAVKSRWNDFHQKLQYARKQKETYRLREIIPGLKELSKKHPTVTDLVFNTGCILAELDKNEEALEQFVLAASNGGLIAQASYNAACLALRLGDEPRACWHLIASLRAELPRDDTWFTLVRLVHKHRCHELWNVLFAENTPGDERVSAVRLELKVRVVEVVAFELARSGRRVDASALLHGLPETFPDAETLGIAVDALGNEPSKEWGEFRRSLDEREEKRKEEEARRVREQRDRDERGRQALSEQLALAQAGLSANGYVHTVFHDRGFGYLRDLEGKDRWFTVKGVTDPEIKNAVQAFAKGNEVSVTCDYYVNNEAGGKLAARNLRACRTADQILVDARALAKEGAFAQSISLLERLGKVVKDNPEIEALLQSLRSEAWRSTSIPGAVRSGEGLIGQARQAQNARDFERAQTLYRQAIRSENTLETAVKELALMLHNTMKQSDDAIQILKEHLTRLHNQYTALQILSTIYEQTGRFEEAIAELKKVSALAPRKEDRLKVDKRIAYCMFKMGDYGAAELKLERYLKETYQDDPSARSWLEALRRAQKSGQYDEVVEFVERHFQDFRPNQLDLSSSMLKFALDSCKYFGLPNEDITSGNFSLKTLAYLEREVALAGRDRQPRENADRYLTAARICQDIGAEHNDRKLNYLRQYCSLMGDGEAVNGTSADVIRSYYQEAFLIEDRWGSQLSVKSAQYMLSYIWNVRDLLRTRIPRIDEAVNLVFTEGGPPRGFWDGLLNLFILNGNSAVKIVPAIYENLIARQSSLTFLSSFTDKADPNCDLIHFKDAWEVARTQRKKEQDHRAHELETLLGDVRIEPNKIVKIIQLLSECSLESWFCDMDHIRILSLKEIANTLHQYCHQSDYDGKREKKDSASGLIEKLTKDIEKYPTRFSRASLYSLLQELGRALKTSFEEVERGSVPKVEAVLLALTGSNQDVVSLSVEVTNGKGCSPISNVEIRIDEDREFYTPLEPVYRSVEDVRGGGQTTISCTLRPTAKTVQAGTIPVRGRLSYRDSNNRPSDPQPFEMRLDFFDPAEVDALNESNPFSADAESGAVVDENMFYGRKEVLAEIKNALLIANTKCFVLYGQKRSGKSSVIHHLHVQLDKEAGGKFICINFSLGSVINHVVERGDKQVSPHFFHRIASQLQKELRLLESEGVKPPPFEPPSLDQLCAEGTFPFETALRDFQRACRRFPGWEDRRLLVIIDEFTYLYEPIRLGKIHPEFLKSWKAMIESNLFSAVIVGQDVMRKFMEDYPNEFGSARDLQLDYLQQEDAYRLLSEPISRIGGRDGPTRLKGRVTDRLFDLTAGSPFYVQIIGRHLCDLMKRKKLKYATTVELNLVADQLIQGAGALKRKKHFDNLLSAGEDGVVDVKLQDTWPVLCAIAENSAAGSCSRSSISVGDENKTDKVLLELVTRKVVECPQKGFYKIRVGLFREWILKNHEAKE